VPSASIIALMMEAVSTPETSVNSNQTTRCNNIPEDSHLGTRHRENLKSHEVFPWMNLAPYMCVPEKKITRILNLVCKWRLRFFFPRKGTVFSHW
jgi:hypothetical protein